MSLVIPCCYRCSRWFQDFDRFMPFTIHTPLELEAKLCEECYKLLGHALLLWSYNLPIRSAFPDGCNWHQDYLLLV